MQELAALATAMAAAFEHAETYLRTAFGFIGISNVEVIVAEGLAAGSEHREAAVAAAEQQIATLAAQSGSGGSARTVPAESPDISSPPKNSMRGNGPLF